MERALIFQNPRWARLRISLRARLHCMGKQRTPQVAAQTDNKTGNRNQATQPCTSVCELLRFKGDERRRASLASGTVVRAD